MANTKRKYGPAFIANAVANIYTPPAATIISYIYHIHICNVTAAAAVFTLYVGATGGSAAGTQISGGSHSVAAGAEYDMYFPLGLPLKSTDFLTGVCGTASALTITLTVEDKTVD